VDRAGIQFYIISKKDQIAFQFQFFPEFSNTVKTTVYRAGFQTCRKARFLLFYELRFPDSMRSVVFKLSVYLVYITFYRFFDCFEAGLSGLGTQEYHCH
jgi:hypothetical protein